MKFAIQDVDTGLFLRPTPKSWHYETTLDKARLFKTMEAAVAYLEEEAVVLYKCGSRLTLAEEDAFFGQHPDVSDDEMEKMGYSWVYGIAGGRFEIVEAKIELAVE